MDIAHKGSTACKEESGCKSSPIWLLGDSLPKRWADALNAPLDPRHPARHNIWTPILEGIQECVFRSRGLRVDTSEFYTRNAVQDPDDKPKTKVWAANLEQVYSTLLNKFRPTIVFTFGSFAYEFARRSLKREDQYAITYWSAEELGKAFQTSIKEFNVQKINVIPLLHVSIARGKFLDCHRNFTAAENCNYFRYTACKISGLLLDHKTKLDIWVPRQ